jgi:hypothetical protein
MTHEEERELQVLSDAEARPLLGRYYSFKSDPELAATARRLGREPAPRLIEVSETVTPLGPAICVTSIREAGKSRLRYLRLKKSAVKQGSIR